MILRERYDLSDALFSEEKHYQSVETVSKSCMRRCSVFEGFNQESELHLALFFCKTEYFEHAGLQILVMDSYATAAKFNTVENDIISIGLESEYVRIKLVQFIELRLCEWMVHRAEVAVLILLKHREINYPEEVVLVIIEKSHHSGDPAS